VPYGPGVTVSIGVAAYPEDGSTTRALLDAADTALYRAKAEGRDRVVAAGAA
jgi:diguanylate cyclase (GGDEF)-like protein